MEVTYIIDINIDCDNDEYLRNDTVLKDLEEFCREHEQLYYANSIKVDRITLTPSAVDDLADFITFIRPLFSDTSTEKDVE